MLFPDTILKTSQVITLHNVGKKWSGAWYIKRCIHKLEGSSGYTTEMELIRHKGVEGYSAVTQTNHHGHNTSNRNSGGGVSSKALTNVNLTSAEAIYFNAASRIKKEDFEKKLRNKFPGSDIEVRSYDAIADDYKGSNTDPVYIDSSDKTKYPYVRIVTHVILDGNSLYVTSGTGFIGTVNDAYKRIFRSINSLI